MAASITMCFCFYLVLFLFFSSVVEIVTMGIEEGANLTLSLTTYIADNNKITIQTGVLSGIIKGSDFVAQASINRCHCSDKLLPPSPLFFKCCHNLSGCHWEEGRRDDAEASAA